MAFSSRSAGAGQGMRSFEDWKSNEMKIRAGYGVRFTLVRCLLCVRAYAVLLLCPAGR